MATNGVGTPHNWTIMVYIAADDELANFAVESLKQLKDTADDRVRVAAQIGIESSKTRVFDRYVFETPRQPNGADTSILSLSDFQEPAPALADMTKPATLTSFIQWAAERCPAQQYCLILWGHGPELLYEAPKRKGGKRLYFTPVQLGKAVKNSGTHLQIIGMDACNMSMVEFAYQLQGLADFMIASQDDVPDPSFPYDTLVGRFSEQGADADALCRTSVAYYVRAYQDYICNSQTGVNSVTLSALRLSAMSGLKDPLAKLVSALKGAEKDPKLGEAIYEARKDAQGFVGELFVDLQDFCEKLAAHPRTNNASKDACTDVSDALAKCVVKHQVASQPADIFSCHGLSIYFPYPAGKAEIDNSNLLKGPGPDDGTNGGKFVEGFHAVNNAARGFRSTVYEELKKDADEYYQAHGFRFQDDTAWLDFIKHTWVQLLKENKAKKAAAS